LASPPGTGRGKYRKRGIPSVRPGAIPTKRVEVKKGDSAAVRGKKDIHSWSTVLGQTTGEGLFKREGTPKKNERLHRSRHFLSQEKKGIREPPSLVVVLRA